MPVYRFDVPASVCLDVQAETEEEARAILAGACESDEGQDCYVEGASDARVYLCQYKAEEVGFIEETEVED